MKYKDEFELNRNMSLLVIALALALAFFGDRIYDLLFNF
jgi:hypothetical protein